MAVQTCELTNGGAWLTPKGPPAITPAANPGERQGKSSPRSYYMPQPARTTILLSNFFGLHAKPKRGAKPHCLPVRVELLTPLVGNSLLLPAMMKPFETILS